MASWYETSKAHVQAIEKAYDDLMAAIDAYDAYLKEAPSEPDALRIALGMQAKGLSRMRDTLENQALDDLIRFSDRVIRIKHWEDGRFL